MAPKPQLECTCEADRVAGYTYNTPHGLCEYCTAKGYVHPGNDPVGDDDPFSLGGTPEDRAVMVHVGPTPHVSDDEFYGKATRDERGEPIKPTRAPQHPRGTAIADQRDAIQAGMRRLEQERTEILNRPDPDLVPTIRPKWGSELADDVTFFKFSNWVGRRICAVCRIPNDLNKPRWRYACNICIAKISDAAREEYYQECVARENKPIQSPVWT